MPFKAKSYYYQVWEGRWRVIPYHLLPDWLKDNDYLLHGHRPPMPSFRACFGSIFRIHTETGNIWTHLLGLCLWYMTLWHDNAKTYNVTKQVSLEILYITVASICKLAIRKTYFSTVFIKRFLLYYICVTVQKLGIKIFWRFWKKVSY